MSRFLPSVLSLVLLSSFAVAQNASDLKAPKTWSGERITLPPGFAADMKWRGVEEIRFAPGMFKPDSESFFSYVFVFELDQEADLTQQGLQQELLVYYRGLAKAVLRGRKVEVKPETFSLQLKPQPVEGGPQGAKGYVGDLQWLEPFRTQKPQTLHMDAQAWKAGQKQSLFVCVSPQDKQAEIWKEMYKIRSSYYDGFKK